MIYALGNHSKCFVQPHTLCGHSERKNEYRSQSEKEIPQHNSAPRVVMTICILSIHSTLIILKV
jgi:hypothetical protein